MPFIFVIINYILKIFWSKDISYSFLPHKLIYSSYGRPSYNYKATVTIGIQTLRDTKLEKFEISQNQQKIFARGNEQSKHFQKFLLKIFPFRISNCFPAPINVFFRLLPSILEPLCGWGPLNVQNFRLRGFFVNLTASHVLFLKQVFSPEGHSENF